MEGLNYHYKVYTTKLLLEQLLILNIITKYLNIIITRMI